MSGLSASRYNHSRHALFCQTAGIDWLSPIGDNPALVFGLFGTRLFSDVDFKLLFCYVNHGI